MNKNKKQIIFYFIILSLTLNYFYAYQTIAQEKKPDLIIESVSSTIIKTQIKYDPLRPVRGGKHHSFIEYIITVRNIGTADFADAFYISWSNNDSDIYTGHYSGTSIVNQDKNPISIGESLDIKVKVINSAYSNRSKKFLFNTDGNLHLINSLPFIEELNYDNNAYMY